MGLGALGALGTATGITGAITGAVNTRINAAGTLANALRGSISNGGSVNSSRSAGANYADSWSNTAGNIASARSQAYADMANATARANWDTAAGYNASQAEINRIWQEYMANTQYQRAVQDMRKAGLNPILAAQNGIGGASIGSGAQASLTAPQTFMGHSIAEQNSAMHSEGWNESSSSGSSWTHSEEGLATGLKLMGDAIGGVLANLQSGNTIQLYLDQFREGFKDNLTPSWVDNAVNKVKVAQKAAIDTAKKIIGGTAGAAAGAAAGASAKRKK